jgi:hypothetical protein
MAYKWLIACTGVWCGVVCCCLQRHTRGARAVALDRSERALGVVRATHQLQTAQNAVRAGHEPHRPAPPARRRARAAAPGGAREGARRLAELADELVRERAHSQPNQITYRCVCMHVCTHCCAVLVWCRRGDGSKYDSIGGLFCIVRDTSAGPHQRVAKPQVPLLQQAQVPILPAAALVNGLLEPTQRYGTAATTSTGSRLTTPHRLSACDV